MFWVWHPEGEVGSADPGENRRGEGEQVMGLRESPINGCGYVESCG